MDDKKFVILIYSGMGLLVTGLMIFLFISIKSNSKRNNQDINYENIKTLNSDEKIFSSKTVAYESSDKDSFLNIRDENVGVDFSSLFKDDPSVNSSMENSKATDYDNSSKEKIDISSSSVETHKKTVVEFKQKREATTKNNNTKGAPSIITSSESSAVTNSSTSTGQPKRRDGFYSTNSKGTDSEKTINSLSLRAVIHSRQEAYQGSTVKMRTIAPLTIDGSIIPSNTFIYGIATMGQERIRIKVSSIIYNNSLFRVEYSVFDRDGIEGVYVPGLLLHDISKETERNVIKDINLNVPVVGSVPVTVSRKKIAEQKAILTQDYEVILKN